VGGQALLDGVCAEWGAAAGREDRVGGLAGPFGEPGAQDRGERGGERGDALLAALAQAVDVGAGRLSRVPWNFGGGPMIIRLRSRSHLDAWG